MLAFNSLRIIDFLCLSTSLRDKYLSTHVTVCPGQEQARNVAHELIKAGSCIRYIMCSPLVRCVQTADIVAAELGLREGTLLVEPGLIEECKSMRGKMSPEPRPVWPLTQPLSELRKVSVRIDESYTPLLPVCHVKNEAYYNHVQEILPDDSDADLDSVTRIRCRKFMELLLADTGVMAGEECVLCVGHGASVKYCAEALQEGLDPDLLIAGERSVSCFAAFRPIEISARTGPWFVPEGVWGTGGMVFSVDGADSGGSITFCDNPNDQG